ncbi:MAG: 6-phosphofructokinase [Clostridiales Family XIII bacterium]|jgi:6-phosphofructokinase 1|nr:6-phosphofructokinase [Clostridiales Family XIII bacterium]
MKKNMLIAQSGGPSAVINASLAGAIKKAMKSKNIGKIYGGIHGLQGILEGQIIDIKKQIKNGADLKKLAETPAMALGSCRFKLAKTPDKNYKKVFEICKKLNIGYFFYIGGNDSMDTVKNLSEYFASLGENILGIGIPKTIDNDLCITDHTPGFASAAKYVATAISETFIDASVYPQKTVMIVEIMGRNAGWLVASSALARLMPAAKNAPDLIYFPEIPFDEDDFIKRIDNLSNKKTTIVVAVSEGIKNKKGEYLAESKTRGVSDKFGHAALGGAGKYLESLLLKKLAKKKLKTRAVELNILQRVGGHIVSKTDFKEAFKVGEIGVKYALAGKNGVMPTIKRISDNPYKVEYIETNIDKIANFEKKIPNSFISKSGIDITKKMLNYLKPLIEGEHKIIYKNGLPDFFSFDWNKTI